LWEEGRARGQPRLRLKDSFLERFPDVGGAGFRRTRSFGRMAAEVGVQ